MLIFNKIRIYTLNASPVMDTAMNPQRASAYLLLLICVFAWGSVFPLAKEILQAMSGLSLAIWRFVFAAAAIALFIALRRIPLRGLTPVRGLVLLGIGVVGIGGFNFGLFTGLQQTAAINGALIMAMSPLVNALLDAIIRRRWLQRGQTFSLLLACAGVLLVITDGHLLALPVNRGDLWIIAAMLCWSFYTLTAKATAHWLPPLFFTLLTMLGACAALLCASLFSPAAAPLSQLLALPAADLAGVIYIGLFATVFGYLFWNRGVATLGVTSASLFFNLVPVFAALTGLLAGQTINRIQLAGMLIVIAALMAPPLWQQWRQRLLPAKQ